MSKEIGFLSSFNKELEKIDGITTCDQPPRYSYNTGNYVLNKITSGSFYHGGIACQGRIGVLAGPSGSGKSFLLCNLIREAQKQGAHILVIDSENALSSDFVSAIGVNPTENYTYVGVVSIPHVVNVVSSFLKKFKDAFEDQSDPETPQVLIAIDSLDMLMTSTELENYDKGVQKGDQGQKNKQLKAFLKTLVQDIKTLNVSVVATSQVYRNQEVTNGEGVWIISDAIRYSASTITLLTKLKLREDAEVTGIRMKCEGYKARYTKPFQTVTIEVPYDTGMDPYSGLVETLTDLGVIKTSGGWLKKKDGSSFRAKEIGLYINEFLKEAEQMTNVYLKSSVLPEELADQPNSGES